MYVFSETDKYESSQIALILLTYKGKRNEKLVNCTLMRRIWEIMEPFFTITVQIIQETNTYCTQIIKFKIGR